MINRLMDYDLENQGYRTVPQLPEDADAASSPLNKIESLTQEHPVALIAVGLATGVLLGYWVKRKS